MPVQTTKTTNVYWPDGCKIEVKASGGAYVDVGAIMGNFTSTLEWKENQVEFANAGKSSVQVKDMIMKGKFTLANLDPEILMTLGNGVITHADTAASENSSIPDQIIPSGWTDSVKYELLPETSSSDDTILKLPDKPVFTSVKIATGTTPETLTEDNDYVVVADGASQSGWSIVFIEAGMTEKGNGAITIDWGANTPDAALTLYAGASTYVMTAYALKATHTDAAAKTRTLELFAVKTVSGGFNFGFKGASESGVEEMEVSFEAQIDTALTDGRQLFSYTVQSGAA